MSYPPMGTNGGSRPNTRVPNTTPDYPGSPAYQRREADLARVRENQRRSRARRREYVMDLENRLRQCELLGIEASAEVALGARRVTEENRQLRELLHAHGVDDRHIAHYIQNASGTWEVAPGTIPPIAGESPVQSLEQLLAPRRPASLEPTIPTFVLPSNRSRETSVASQTASTPPPWQASPPSADTTTYASPSTSAASSRAAEFAPVYSYPTPFMASLPSSYHASTAPSDASVPRTQRLDPPTPSRAFEDDEQDHFNHTPSGVEEDTRIGCTAPANTYSRIKPHRPGRHGT